MTSTEIINYIALGMQEVLIDIFNTITTPRAIALAIIIHLAVSTFLIKREQEVTKKLKLWTSHAYYSYGLIFVLGTLYYIRQNPSDQFNNNLAILFTVFSYFLVFGMIKRTEKVSG